MFSAIGVAVVTGSFTLGAVVLTYLGSGLREWKALLAEANVREARLHDARHTAATVLLLLGVRERAVMDVMGWSNTAMVKRYAHVTARLRRDIANQLNSYLWGSK